MIYNNQTSARKGDSVSTESLLSYIKETLESLEKYQDPVKDIKGKEFSYDGKEYVVLGNSGFDGILVSEKKKLDFFK